LRLAPYHLAYSRDPAATWRRILAARQTIGYDPDLELWLIGGYANVRTGLTDTAHFGNSLTLAPIKPLAPAAAAVMSELDLQIAPDIVSSDPPEHTHLRALLRSVVPTTGSGVQRRWGALVLRRAEQLADHLTGQATVDLMEQVAHRLPLLIILDVLGIPEREADTIARWSNDAIDVIAGDPTPEEQVSAMRGYGAFRRYCQDLVNDHIAAAAAGDSPPGVIGELVAYRGGDDRRLAAEQVASLVLDLIIAGWETTAAALGHCLENALQGPGRWARLATDDHYLATYVEETLRHSPPVDGWLRVTTRDVELDGVTIPEGSRCLLLIGTAHRDPIVYDDPDAFNPGRARLAQHLAFGAGAHHCIGLGLARLELATTLRVLAARLPGLRLAPDYARRFRPSALMRIHTTMPAVTTGGQCPVGHASLQAAQQ
jgi:cytochrome P450